MRTMPPLHHVLAQMIGGFATGLIVLRPPCGVLRLRHPLRTALSSARERHALRGARAYLDVFASMSGFCDMAIETRLEATEATRYPALHLVFPHVIRDIIVSADRFAEGDAIRLALTLDAGEQSIRIEELDPSFPALIDNQIYVSHQELQALSRRWLNGLTHLLGDLSCLSLAMQIEPPTAHARLAAIMRLQNFERSLH